MAGRPTQVAAAVRPASVASLRSRQLTCTAALGKAGLATPPMVFEGPSTDKPIKIGINGALQAQEAFPRHNPHAALFCTHSFCSALALLLLVAHCCAPVFVSSTPRGALHCAGQVSHTLRVLGSPLRVTASLLLPAQACSSWTLAHQYSRSTHLLVSAVIPSGIGLGRDIFIRRFDLAPNTAPASMERTCTCGCRWQLRFCAKWLGGHPCLPHERPSFILIHPQVARQADECTAAMQVSVALGAW